MRDSSIDQVERCGQSEMRVAILAWCISRLSTLMSTVEDECSHSSVTRQLIKCGDAYSPKEVCRFALFDETDDAMLTSAMTVLMQSLA